MLGALVTDFVCPYSRLTTKNPIIYPSRGEFRPAGYASQIAGLKETLKEPNCGSGLAKIRTLFQRNLKWKSAAWMALLKVVPLGGPTSNSFED